ncbi:hypothetical protein PYCC9005_003012 [Savitreella phatthalungensis]
MLRKKIGETAVSWRWSPECRELTRPFVTTPFVLGKKNKKVGRLEEAEALPREHFDKTSFELGLAKVIDSLSRDLSDLKAGRQDPKILSQLRVRSSQHDGVLLNSLAAISQRDQRTLLVSVYDGDDVKAVQKAIQEANLNFNPQPTAKSPLQLAISLPRMTQEKRKELHVQMVRRADVARTQLRAERGDAMKAVKKSAGSENERAKLEKEVTAIVEKLNKNLEQSLEAAQQAVMSI